MPRLPNVSLAHVPMRKLTHYLLDPTHADGGPKARFLAAFGFSPSAPAALAEALRRHAAEHDCVVQRQTEFGTMYEIVGRLHTPDARSPLVRTAWIIDAGDSTARFVTLVPERGPRWRRE